MTTLNSSWGQDIFQMMYLHVSPMSRVLSLKWFVGGGSGGSPPRNFKISTF